MPGMVYAVVAIFARSEEYLFYSHWILFLGDNFGQAGDGCLIVGFAQGLGHLHTHAPKWFAGIGIDDSLGIATFAGFH